MSQPRGLFRSEMSALIRYWLLQIPGVLFLGALLWWVVSHGWMQPKTSVWILGLWLVKDAVLYPLYKPALERGPGHGTEALVGRVCKVVWPLDPRGQVRVSGELWAAVSRRSDTLPRGTQARIVGARGLTLIVEPIGRVPA